jgi:hypothetical protein
MAKNIPGVSSNDNNELTIDEVCTELHKMQIALSPYSALGRASMTYFGKSEDDVRREFAEAMNYVMDGHQKETPKKVRQRDDIIGGTVPAADMMQLTVDSIANTARNIVNETNNAIETSSKNGCFYACLDWSELNGYQYKALCAAYRSFGYILTTDEFNPRSVTLSWDLSPSEEADVDGSDK